MKKIFTVGAVLLLTTTAATAGGLDRSGQGIGAIFEDGRYTEFSFGAIRPSLSGTDAAAFNGMHTGNVAGNYNQIGFAYKMDINPKTSFALIFDQPYGADIEYATAADGGSVALGGTKAYLESSAITAMARYKFDDKYSVHGGLRAETISADIALGGAAYGGLNGYTTSLAENTAYGYSVGAAYERKDIALRVALTYHSSIEHVFDTTENGGPSLPTTVNTPQAVNLDFQTGVAADTLVFGSIRWADYSELTVSPAGFSAATAGGSLTNIDDSISYNIGVGRKFSDVFSGSLSVGYEAAGESDLVSPLAPSNGNYSIALGGKYTMNNVSFSGGIRYIVPGDAEAETADTSRASFADNSAVAVGFKVAYNF